MSKSTLILYEQVVKVTNVYLGPAADRFITRQIENHLDKPPQQMSREDLSQLIDWIRVAMSLITEDSDIVEEYTEQLRQLADGETPKNAHRSNEQ